ncbi:Protein unc-50-like protein [Wallemia ichthyophaga EXF-994]|uniref:Protein unc-50-like protein n=1 Tax=Wallemia ichthyophaga (strain EXF-994 / CBS 113033) TaxID=1299270 RepID=R9AHQ5_WALI9|nr:Protein unc-50-like protein [Wallemia ichthyophaga EXF-994]EOR01718.1 Protein unc-50-like protein [Wallemia ichthyophaga EXF-994]
MLPRPINSSSAGSSSKYRRRNIIRSLSYKFNFDLALLQLFYLTISPRRFYRQLYYHKQTKNRWARDDPTIAVIIAATLAVSGLGWSLSLHLGWRGLLKLLFRMLLVDYVLIGGLISTCFWLFANKFLTQTPTYTTTNSQSIEFRYAVDVHTNGYFVIVLIIYLIQLFLYPLLVKDEWICTLFGNTLYVVALLHYVHVTYLGYAALPSVNNSELILFLASVIIVLYLASLVGFNVSRACLSWYFGMDF